MKGTIERERRRGRKRRVKLPEKLKERRKRDREGRVKLAGGNERNRKREKRRARAGHTAAEREISR